MFLRQRLAIDGTADIVLDTNDHGFALLIAAAAFGTTLNYTITSQDRIDYETGTGTISAGGVFDRATVTASSNAAALVNFGAGSHAVNIETSGGSVSDGDKGDVVVSGSGATWLIEAALKTSVVGATFDGGGSVVAAATVVYVQVPYACTIVEAVALANISGNAVVDVWKDTYANYPPVDADSITSATPVTLTAAVKSANSTLTGWTKAIAAGDVLAFNVDSCSAATRLQIQLKVIRT